MSAIWDLVVQGAPTGVGAILACLLAFYMVRSRERRLMLRARSEADKAGIANIAAILASATDSINILRSALKRAEELIEGLGAGVEVFFDEAFEGFAAAHDELLIERGVAVMGADEVEVQRDVLQKDGSGGAG